MLAGAARSSAERAFSAPSKCAVAISEPSRRPVREGKSLNDSECEVVRIKKTARGTLKGIKTLGRLPSTHLGYSLSGDSIFQRGHKIDDLSRLKIYEEAPSGRVPMI